MKSATCLAIYIVLLFGVSSPMLLADDDRAADEAKRDLEKLQGKWETTLRAGGQPIHNVQTIKGTTSTVERFDEKGQLVHSHSASFKLSVKDRVRIFTFFDLRVTDGPRKGQRFQGPLSFIYALNDDVWTEARGLLADQRDGNPRMTFWKKIVKDEVALRASPRHFPRADPRK